MSRRIAGKLSAYLKDGSGVTAIEYSIIAASVSLGIASVLRLIGVDLTDMYGTIAGFFT